jgi:hypothetical protein
VWAKGWIPEDRHTRESRNSLLEQLEPFRAQLDGRDCQAGHVGARPRKARRETTSHGITDLDENDRNGSCGVLRGYRCRRPLGQEHVHFRTNQVSSEIWKSLQLVLRPPKFHRDVLALDPAEIAQTVSKPLNDTRVSGGRRAAQEAYPINLPRLLGLDGKRHGEENEDKGEGGAMHPPRIRVRESTHNPSRKSGSVDLAPPLAPTATARHALTLPVCAERAGSAAGVRAPRAPGLLKPEVGQLTGAGKPRFIIQ